MKTLKNLHHQSANTHTQTTASLFVARASTLFKAYRYYFLILASLVSLSILAVVTLISVNFWHGKKYTRNNDCNLRAKKNVSFDFIDNGYLQSKRGLKFKSFSRSPSQRLSDDKDYHFEDLTRALNTSESEKTSDASENIYELPYMETLEFVESKNEHCQKLAKSTTEQSLKFKTFSTKRYDSLKGALTRNEERPHESKPYRNNCASTPTTTLHSNKASKFKFNARHGPTMVSFNNAASSKCLASSQFDRVKVVRV